SSSNYMRGWSCVWRGWLGSGFLGRHQGGDNLLYVDGHAALYPKSFTTLNNLFQSGDRTQEPFSFSNNFNPYF
ncbi:MAG: hypothetical protein WAX69_18925, partial [Victivallales bacterium]